MTSQGTRNGCDTNDLYFLATRRPNAARARFVSKPTSGTDENPRTNEGVGIVLSVPPPVDRVLPRLAHLHQRARSRRRSCRESKAAPEIQIRVIVAAAVAAPSLPHAREKARRARVVGSVGSSTDRRNNRCGARLDVAILSSLCGPQDRVL